MQTKGAISTESRIVRLAANQHGVISVRQLTNLGLGAGAIKYRAATGRLHRVHRGVYAVGHAGLSNEGRWMAAVLAVGRDAVLSHSGAAALWRLMPPLNAGVDIDVSIPGHGGAKRRIGIRIHRSKTLTENDTTLRNRIPVTTPARTLGDLRSRLTDAEFNSALRQAEVQGLPVDGIEIAGGEPSRTVLERRFVALCRRHRLPAPEVNAPIGRYQADFLWREARLIAETDGWRFHRGRANFELDRRRAADLATAGYEVMRFTWRQATEEPHSVATALGARLAAR